MRLHEADLAREALHGPVGGKRDSMQPHNAAGACVLHQRIQQQAAYALALPGVRDHDGELGAAGIRVSDVAGISQQADFPAVGGDSDEGHFPPVIDARQMPDLLRRQVSGAKQAVVAAVPRQAANERAFDGIVIRVYRPYDDIRAVGQAPGANQVGGIARWRAAPVNGDWHGGGHILDSGCGVGPERG